MQLVDPVMRPDQLAGLSKLQTVVFDLDLPQGLAGRKVLIKELKRKLQQKGFKVMTYGDEERKKFAWPKVKDLLGREEAVVIHLAIRDENRMALKSESMGSSPKAGLALATGLHWSILQGVKQKNLGELADDRISVGNSKAFENVEVLACGLELSYDFWEDSAGEKLPRALAESVGRAIAFARKAARQK